MTPATSLEGHRNGQARYVRGKTRHLILVRHGQYEENSGDTDEDRKLTPLGRQQATQTGQRLAEIAKGSTSFRNPSSQGACKIRAIRVSNMTRAKETADLIAQELGQDVTKPDRLLNEALPSPMIPCRPDIQGATEEIDENHDRVEQAFRKYFYRSNTHGSREHKLTDFFHPHPEDEDDEFEVIVCHGNIIRYFFCRALQLPPEAWLRFSIFNCSLTYLIIRPNGTVSARMLGDIGHLSYNESTFSGYHGFKW